MPLIARGKKRYVGDFRGRVFLVGLGILKEQMGTAGI